MILLELSLGYDFYNSEKRKEFTKCVSEQHVKKCIQEHRVWEYLEKLYIDMGSQYASIGFYDNFDLFLKFVKKMISTPFYGPVDAQ